MSKPPFDLFKALGEAAKIVDEVAKAAARNRDSRGKSRANLSAEDFAAGILDAMAKNFASPGSTSQPPPRNRSERKPDRSEERRQQAARWHASEVMRGALVEATIQATRDYQRSKTAVMNEIKGHMLRLQHDRAALLRAPDKMPLTNEDTAATYFSDIKSRAAVLAQQLEQIFADLKPTYRAIAESRAAEHSPAPTTQWQERAEQEWLRQLEMKRAHHTQIDRDAGKLAGELERFRAELAATDFGSARAGFDPAQPLLRQFRKGMMLGAADLVQIRAMIDADWTVQHAAFAALPFKDVLHTARDWQQDGMPAEATNFVIAMFGRLTLFQALREMGLDKADALQSVSPAEQVKPVDRPAGVQLLTRIPGDLPLTTDVQRDRLIDALVLASECAMPPIEIYALGKNLAQLAPVPVAQGDEARLRHYHQLIARLEASQLETVGKKTGEKCNHSFMPLHLVLLRQLRAAAGVDAPSAAEAAWENHLANREAIRADLFSRASEFWHPMLTEILDVAGVSDHDRFTHTRAMLQPLAKMDAAARRIVWGEAKAIVKAFNTTAIGMASKADGWRSITAPFGNAQRQRLLELIDVLSMGDAGRAAYFAPPPEAPPLGKFGDLVVLLSIQRNHFNYGRFGEALRALDFDAADQDVRQWLAEAPPSALRDAMLEFDLASLRIRDRNVLGGFAANPKCAAVGLDWSGHVLCEISKPDEGVPFEIGSYARGAFPEGEFGVEMLRAHARHPFPWQGGFDDVTTGFVVDGIAPLVLQLYDFRNDVRDDWGKDMRAYHGAMDELCTAFMFLAVNRLVARELAANPPARALPVIVGTHDFGFFDPIIHTAG